MSAPNDGIKASSPPESPTTARPFELDDDDVPEPGPTAEEPHPAAAATAMPTTTSSGETPPAKPPRPLTEQQKNELILKEAFPSVEAGVVKAVLSASRGQIEPAFNALLEMTDPDAVNNEPRGESPPPPQPPRPTDNAKSQLEADEIYARQLAEHYENVSAYEARTTSRQQGQRQDHPRSQYSRGQPHPGEIEREYSFIDDELPVIRDNLRKGFADTQTKVNGWIQTLKKKMDEAFDDEEDPPQGTQGYGRGQAPYGARQYGAQNSRSGDYHRYDADPEVLGDDFAGIRLSPDGSAANQNRNNVFRPPPSSTSPRPERKVGFKEEAEDIYSSSPLPPSKETPLKPATKSSKWQPLTTVDAAPMAENDPFSLGDSDDDKEVAKEPTSKPAAGWSSKLDDSERLKQAAAEAMADSLVESKPGPESSVKKD